MGIKDIYIGKNLSRRHSENKVYPYLLRKVTAAYYNDVWGIDITYIRLHGGWLYLVAVIDWFSSYVVSWELDQTLEMLFVVTTVEWALAQASPLIWNSDQGSHSPARSTPSCCCRPACRSVWMVKGVRAKNSFAPKWHYLRVSPEVAAGFSPLTRGLDSVLARLRLIVTAP